MKTDEFCVWILKNLGAIVKWCGAFVIFFSLTVLYMGFAGVLSFKAMSAVLITFGATYIVVVHVFIGGWWSYHLKNIKDKTLRDEAHKEVMRIIYSKMRKGL